MDEPGVPSRLSPVSVLVTPGHFLVAITVQIWMAVDINLLEISFNADDSKLAYDAPYDRLRTWYKVGKSGRMFIYFGGLILASYVRSVWQKDDVLRKKFSSTEDVL